MKEVVANDMEPGAVETIRRNTEFSRSGDKVVPNEGDAIMVMMNHRHTFSFPTDFKISLAPSPNPNSP